MSEKKNEFGSRLGRFVDEKFGPRQHVHAAPILGVTQAQLSRFVNGKTMPEMDTVQRMADALGVTAAELLGVQLPTLHAVDQSKYRLIPDWGVVSAGPPLDPGGDANMIPVADLPTEGDFISLIVRGRSMEPSVPDGARVIIRVQPSAEPGETVVAVIGDESGGGLTLKKLRRRRGKLYLDSVGDGPGPVEVGDRARVLGVLKSYTVTVAG